MGSIEFDASYLEGRPLHCSFEGTNQEMATLQLPDPPGRAGNLELMVMALLGSHQAIRTASLAANDRWVMAKVFPDAHTEFVTNTSPTTESGRDASLRAALDVLVGGKAL